jgi:hypothetical protein
MSAMPAASISVSLRPSRLFALVADDEAAVPGHAGANGSRITGSGVAGVGGAGFGAVSAARIVAGANGEGFVSAAGIVRGGANGEGFVSAPRIVSGGANGEGFVSAPRIVSGGANGEGFVSAAAGAEAALGSGAGHSMSGRASASLATS